MRRSSSSVRWPHALALVAFGTATACVLVELSVRIATHSVLVWGSREPDGCCVTDPMLGRVIVTRGSGQHPGKGFTMTIGDHGVRLNGDAPAVARPSSLVVGDSFAFGDGVN